MRGARHEVDDVDVLHGIIPAYAGSTSDGNLWVYHSEDHPRVCGEHLTDASGRLFVQGSSPRMRGALWLAVLHQLDIGIIPAYAGSTVAPSS